MDARFECCVGLISLCLCVFLRSYKKTCKEIKQRQTHNTPIPLMGMKKLGSKSPLLLILLQTRTEFSLLFFELLDPYRMDQTIANYYKRFSEGPSLQGFQLWLEFLHFCLNFARVSPCFLMDLLKTNKESD